MTGEAHLSICFSNQPKSFTTKLVDQMESRQITPMKDVDPFEVLNPEEISDVSSQDLNSDDDDDSNDDDESSVDLSAEEEERDRQMKKGAKGFSEGKSYRFPHKRPERDHERDRDIQLEDEQVILITCEDIKQRFSTDKRIFEFDDYSIVRENAKFHSQVKSELMKIH